MDENQPVTGPEQRVRWSWACSLGGMALAAGLMAGSGCAQIKEHMTRVRPNNPVVGPPPPRLSLEEASVDTRGYASITEGAPVSSGEILPVSMTERGELLILPDSFVVAVVNGNPILAGDVFAPYARQLVQMKKQLEPDQFATAQRELLKRDLPSHIERTLLSHALKSTLKQEQIERLDGVLDEAFAEHVANLLEKTGTASAMELDKKLQEEGTSLGEIRQTFGIQQLAMQYIATESQVKVQLGRVDLLNYYQAHIDDYSTPLRVKWQEIRVSVTPQQDRSAAIQKLNEVVQELQTGTSFDQVAKKFSDGPTATLGGQWDWTKQDSLADAKLNEVLFSLPAGSISPIIETPQHFRIIRITDRDDAKIKPFEELQDQIRKEILMAKRKEKTSEVVKNLKATATIQTIFDNDPETAAAMRNIGKSEE